MKKQKKTNKLVFGERTQSELDATKHLRRWRNSSLEVKELSRMECGFKMPLYLAIEPRFRDTAMKILKAQAS